MNKTLMGKVMEMMKATGGYAWSTDIADNLFNGNRKECLRWMKSVLVADGMVTFVTTPGTGNFYSLTMKGRGLK